MYDQIVKKARGQLLGLKYRQDFQVSGGKKQVDARKERTSFGTIKVQKPCEVQGGNSSRMVAHNL